MIATVRSGIPAPVFVAGIKYPSIFDASMELGVSYNATHKAIKKSGYGICKIKKNIVVMETWVKNRIKLLGWAV